MNKRTKRIRSKKKVFIPQEIFSQKHVKKKRKKYELYAIYKILLKKIHIFHLLVPLILGGIFFLFFSPFFTVQEIIISSPDKRININKAYESINSFRTKNILLLNEKEIKNNILNALPSTKEIQVTKTIPHLLDINIIPYHALFYSSGSIILSNGNLIESDEKPQDIDSLILSVDTDDSLNVISLNAIESILGKIKSRFPEFKIHKNYFAVIENEFIIRNSIGNVFIFDLSKNIDEQIEKLSLFHKNNLNIHTVPFVYLDIRIPQKIYMCGLEDEWKCKKNIEYIYGNDTFFTEKLEESFQPQPLGPEDMHPENL